VAAAVVRVAAALGPARGLDVVEQQDAVVGVEHHRVAELALADAGRPLLAGLVIMAGGLLLLSSAGAGDAYFPTVFIAFLLMGLGAGTAFMPLLTIAMADVPARDAGVASALVNVSLYISGALGLAALGAIATDRTQTLSDRGWAADHALVAGYQLAFVIAAVCVAATVAVALVVLRVGRAVPARA
jgi:MFS family permease